MREKIKICLQTTILFWDTCFIFEVENCGRKFFQDKNLINLCRLFCAMNDFSVAASHENTVLRTRFMNFPLLTLTECTFISLRLQCHALQGGFISHSQT